METLENRKKAISQLEDLDHYDLLGFNAQIESLEERDLKPFQQAAIDGVQRRIEEVFEELDEMYKREKQELIQV